jgi:hypothetical protein
LWVKPVPRQKRVHVVFPFMNHFHQFHLNQIQNWHELNLLHFMNRHLNQFWFQGMLRFFVQNVCPTANHFHQSHLNQIHTWHESNRRHFMNRHLNQSWFQGMLKF